jgi:hypothetical protein
MLDPHAQKVGFLISSFLAIAGTWLDTAQSHLGLVVLAVSGLTGLVMLFNGILSACHNLHQRNKDLKEERDQIAAEKRAMEDLVCEERRRTGVCPMSTFRLPHDHDHDHS